MRKGPLVIAGTGAMACLFGARLAPYADVTLLGTWPEGLRALRSDGIRLETDGTERTVPVRATADPTDCAGTSCALVLVKSWQTARAARQLADCLAPNGVAVTLQNGLGNLEQLRAALGSRRAALGVTTVGATLRGPGHVRAGGGGATYLSHHPALETLASLLHQAGFSIEIVDDLEGLLWGKLAVNAGINPVTALLRVENGDLLTRSGARELVRAAAQEVARVASARGTPLPHSDAAAEAFAVARRTQHNRSSMYQDVLRGAPTEVDAISGAVVREGERCRVPTPVNWTLWQLVRAVSEDPSGDNS